MTKATGGWDRESTGESMQTHLPFYFSLLLDNREPKSCAPLCNGNDSYHSLNCILWYALGPSRSHTISVILTPPPKGDVTAERAPRIGSWKDADPDVPPQGLCFHHSTTLPRKKEGLVWKTTPKCPGG